ncbi:MAG: NAD-dependent epimerase, partial [Myxococcales bacterium]
PPKRVPYGVAAVAAGAADLLAKVGVRLDMSGQLLRASALYTFVSSEKAQRELGYRIRPFDESVRDTLRFFIAEKRLRPFTPELERLAA